MQIKIQTGEQVAAELKNPAFRAAWQTLYEGCAWATVFQSLEFVETWFDCYRSEFDLVLVTGEKSSALVGLLPLAIAKATGELSAAGAHQAEYQTWIAAPEDAAGEFIAAALDNLKAKFPAQILRFLYLAPGAPQGWLQQNKFWRARTELRKIPRPLIRIGDGQIFRDALKKKNSKHQLNSLKKKGAVELVRLVAAEELEAVFDRIIAFGDFRFAAVHNDFHAPDARKKQFYAAMMRVPDLLYASLLKVGDEIASAQINVINRGEILLSISVLNPVFSRYSPNKLHLWLSGAELAAQGFEILDLTPGGEYKDRFATDADEAGVLTVFFNDAARRRHKAKRLAATAAKKILQTLRVERETFDRQLELWRGLKPDKLFSTAEKPPDVRVYIFERNALESAPDDAAVKLNSVEDLLKYEPERRADKPKNVFLRECLAHFSNNFQVFTVVRADRLENCCWLSFEPAKLPVNSAFEPLPNSAALFDFYARENCDVELSRKLLQRGLRAAFEKPNVERVYFLTASDDARLNEFLKSLQTNPAP